MSGGRARHFVRVAGWTAAGATAMSILVPPLAAIVRRPIARPRAIAESFGITLAVMDIVWFAWVALRLLERRW
jgi:hypothetical protein